ncbi:hypothetical protein BDV18DRAFT_158668 [Aspergillus unguis]
MTQRPPDRPYDDDEEMPDVESHRSILETRPHLPARVHSHAQAAAVAATSITEQFVHTFWKKDDKRCEICSPKPLPPPPPPHHRPEGQEHLPIPEALQITAIKAPEIQKSTEILDCVSTEKSALEDRITQLETTLASAPSADSVRALERSLQAEIAQKEQAEAEIRQKNEELDALRKRWKQTARELDKVRSQSQAFYQVTDNHLVDGATRLRYNVRNFAIQYFDGEAEVVRLVVESPRLWDKYVRVLGSDVERLLCERRPSVIQAIIWRFLVGQVFDNFRWAGQTGLALRDMCLTLRPEGQYSDSTEATVPEEERKFQIWLANTTAMVLDASTLENETKEKAETLVDRLCSLIDQFTTSRDASYMSELERIVEEAIILDKEICRQVARIEWVYPGPEAAFDPKTMALGTGERSGKNKVQLAICPGMQKRGKSNGDGFAGPATLLVPMEVSCLSP